MLEAYSQSLSPKGTVPIGQKPSIEVGAHQIPFDRLIAKLFGRFGEVSLLADSQICWR